jgi:hypothetical protein
LDGPAGDYLQHLDEWVDFFVPNLSDDPDEKEIDAAYHNALRHAREVNRELAAR